MKNISPYRLIPPFVLLMDVLCVYVWLSALVNWIPFGIAKPPVSFVSYFILVIGVYSFTRLLTLGNWTIRWVKVASISLSFLLTLVLVRWNLGGGYAWNDPDWFAYVSSLPYALGLGIGAAVYLVWRAVSVERSLLSFEVVYRQFVIELVLIILLLVFWGLSHQMSRDVLTVFTILSLSFFGLGILTLALINLEGVQQEISHYKESTTLFRRRWLFTLLVLVIGIVVVALVLASLLGTSLAGTFFQSLSRGFGWLYDHIIYLLYPLGFVVQLVYWFFQYLASLLRGSNAPPPQFRPDMRPLVPEQPDQSPPEYFLIIITVLKWLLLIGLFGLIIVILWHSLRRNRTDRYKQQNDDENESLWSWRLFRLDFLSFWRWIFSGLRRGQKEHGGSNYMETSAVTDSSGAQNVLYDVRELYRALLWQGREIGLPRHRSETPYEYRKRFEAEVKEGSREIEKITEAYVSQRYGQSDISVEKLKFLNSLWRSLREKFKQKING